MHLHDMTSSKSDVGAFAGDFARQVTRMERALDIEKAAFERGEQLGRLVTHIAFFLLHGQVHLVLRTSPGMTSQYIQRRAEGM